MRRIGFIILAGLTAALAGLVVHSALRTKDAELKKAKLATVEVIVAARELPIGTKLQASDVRAVRWPRDGMPAGTSDDVQAVLGKVVKTEMVTNEPIVSSRLFSGEPTGLLSLVVPPDMRAMSVAVDEVSDIAGFVLPRARVDVLVAVRQQGGVSGLAARAKIVLENIEVLAVAQTTDRKDKPQVEKVVTLLVTPAEAERLALACQEGSLRLALRNYADSRIVVTQGSSVNTLLAAYGGAAEQPRIGQARTAFIPRPAQPALRVEVMRDGISRDALSFGADGREIRPVKGSAAKPPPPLPAQAHPAPAWGNTAVGQAAPAQMEQPAAQAHAATTQGEAQPSTASGEPDNMVAFQGPDAKIIEAH